MQSGWPDTSAGDTAGNAAMKLYIHGTGNLWISIINGDDAVTITTRSEIKRLGGVSGIIASYANLGMEVEAVVTSEVLDVEFCSGTFRPCDTGYILYPKIGRLLAKILHDTSNRSPADQDAWIRGIGQCLHTFGRSDPLCDALADRIAEVYGTGRILLTPLNPYKPWPTGSRTPTEEDISLLYNHRYGMHTADLSAACAALRSTDFGSLCDDSWIKHIASIDN
jgi:hypothetical protein